MNTLNRYITFIFATILLMSCGNEPTQTEVPQENLTGPQVVHLDTAQIRLTELSLVNVEEKEISTLFKVNGFIDVPPQNMVSVSMPLGGYLKSTKLLPGMHFNKGEIIASMEDQKYVDLQQDYLISRARLEMLKKEYERQKELNSSKASSDKVFQQSKEAWESAKITCKSLSEKIRLIGMDPEKLNEQTLTRTIPIYAPISGFVSRVNVNVGKYVNPTDVLFELVNPDDIHLSLNIFEKDMEKLYMGQKVIAYTNNHPEKKYDCEVILIGKDVGAQRSVNIHCHFKDYDKTLVPGTYMNAEMVSMGRKAMVIPEEAVIHDGKDNYVFIQKSPGDYEKIKIEVGITQGSQVELISAEGVDILKEKIVGRGAYTLWMKLNNIAEE